ncbi:methyl-accepting chemotaxis protein [Photobacterium sanguinicancri]|uniref:methyl-accepting chemotaxis protein n=1 Tax=Photobacterium sanguinicancri TaxID=875932 RepID=UPI003D1022B6
MKIRSKLTLLSTGPACLVLFLFGLSIFSVFRVLDMTTQISVAKELEISLLNLRRYEKDFMIRRDQVSIDKFNQQASHFRDLNDELKGAADSIGFDVAPVIEMDREVEQYVAAFLKMSDMYNQLGHEESAMGLVPKIIDTTEHLSVHLHQEEALVAYIELTNLVRDVANKFSSEKLARVNKISAVIMAELKENSDIDGQQDLASLLDQLVQAERLSNTIGLTSKDGLRGQTRGAAHSIESKFDDIAHDIFAEVDADLDTLLYLASIFAFIAISGLLIISELTKRNIIRRIEGLQKMMENVDQRNDLTLRAPIETDDEIGSMSKSINTTLDKLHNFMREVQQVSHTVNDEAVSIRDRSTQAESDLNIQQAETEMVVTAVTEMSATINEIAETTGNAARNAETAQGTARSGLDEVVNTRNVINMLSASLSSTNQLVDDLSTASNNIGAVMNVIGDIAEQTNLLALNAAIEAARAGDQGRGFAVVADEVRTLAQRTQHSTAEISQIIETLQSKTNQVVTNISDCQGHSSDSVSQAESAEERLTQIMVDIALILDSSTQIAAAVEEQSQVTNEVSQNLNNISEVVHKSVGSAEENTTTSMQLSASSEQLKTAVDRFVV